VSVDVYNSLLYWMSERGNLTTQTVKEACKGWYEQLKLRKEIEPLKMGAEPFYVWMDGLRRSGHVEFDGRQCFSVPPAFVVIKEDASQIKGFFVGRRDNALWTALKVKHGDDLKAEAQEQDADRWSYCGEKLGFKAFLADRGIACQDCPSEVLLKRLPRLNRALAGFCKKEMMTLAFLKATYKNNEWEPAPEELTAGLFKDEDDRYCFRLIEDGAVYFLKIGEPLQLARWWVNVREGNVSLHWNDADRTLIVKPNALKLPMILDRLLRLKSGWSPVWSQDGNWCYQGLTFGAAKEVSRIFSVQLEEQCEVH